MTETKVSTEPEAPQVACCEHPEWRHVAATIYTAAHCMDCPSDGYGRAVGASNHPYRPAEPAKVTDLTEAELRLEQYVCGVHGSNRNICRTGCTYVATTPSRDLACPHIRAFIAFYGRSPISLMTEPMSAAPIIAICAACNGATLPIVAKDGMTSLEALTIAGKLPSHRCVTPCERASHHHPSASRNACVTHCSIMSPRSDRCEWAIKLAIAIAREAIAEEGK